MKHTISVLVENRPGVLSKVSGLFSRRGFNIDSLAVGETEKKDISRMTIVVDGNEYLLEQIEKQLNKLIEVIKVKTLREGAYTNRGLVFFKVSFTERKRAEIMQIAELFGAVISDVTRSTITLQFTGGRDRCETLESLLRPYGIKEAVRTGFIAIEKGAATI